MVCSNTKYACFGKIVHNLSEKKTIPLVYLIMFALEMISINP